MSVEVLEQRFEIVPVADLKLHPRNARKGKAAVIAGSLSANGFYGALLVQAVLERTGKAVDFTKVRR